jgi:hypothetical protein
MVGISFKVILLVIVIIAGWLALRIINKKLIGVIIAINRLRQGHSVVLPYLKF